MSGHAGHMTDDQLLECYLAGRTDDALDPRIADHLASCDHCVARYTELAGVMEAVRDEAEAATDEHFPAVRLHEQHAAIMRRIEQVHRSAKVISFPARDVQAAGSSAVRLTPRWLAAAAAAGLFIGVAVGGYLAPDRFHRGAQARAAAPVMSVQRTELPAPAIAAGAQAVSADDDSFLIELELALDRSSTRELRPFDAMTPHVRDIDSRER